MSDDEPAANQAAESSSDEAKSDSVPDPRATDHPVGGDQADENVENESAG